MDEHTRSSLQRTFPRLPWQVRPADDTAAMLTELAKDTESGTIVLVGFDSGRTEALELARRLRSLPAGKAYLMFLLDKHDPESMSRAFRAGADDVLARPVVADELEARIEHGLQYLELARLRERVGADGALMAEMASTAIVNSRNYLDSELRREIERSRRYGHSISVVLASMTMPQPLAERHVREAGRHLLGQLRRDIDWVARYDRACHAMVLPETNLDSAFATATRIARQLARPAPANSDLPPATVWSFGVAAFESVVSADASAPDALLATAEDHLERSRREAAGSVRGGIAAYRSVG